MVIFMKKDRFKRALLCITPLLIFCMVLIFSFFEESFESSRFVLLYIVQLLIFTFIGILISFTYQKSLDTVEKNRKPLVISLVFSILVITAPIIPYTFVINLLTFLFDDLGDLFIIFQTLFGFTLGILIQHRKKRD